MRVHVLVAAAAAMPFCASAHVCPNDPSGKQFINTHVRDKNGYVKYSSAAAARGATPSAMKVGQGVGTNNSMNMHDEPIIITDGSVKVALGQQPSSDGTKAELHGCPGPHVVEVTRWKWDGLSRRVVPETMSYKLNDPADPKATNSIEMWAEKPSETVQAASSAPSMTLTLNSSNPNNVHWVFQHAGILQGSGKDIQDTTRRMSWIRIGGNNARPLRASCYAVQIYHAWSKAPATGQDPVDFTKKELSAIQPACVSNIRQPAVNGSQAPRPDLSTLPNLKKGK